MEKFSQSSDGSWIKRPLSLWVVSHSVASKPALHQRLSGHFHFRVRFLDLQSKDVLVRCFRCQEFADKSDFCKQRYKCGSCADFHDSRQCQCPVTIRPTFVPIVPGSIRLLRNTVLDVNVFPLLFVAHLLILSSLHFLAISLLCLILLCLTLLCFLRSSVNFLPLIYSCYDSYSSSVASLPSQTLFHSLIIDFSSHSPF